VRRQCIVCDRPFSLFLSQLNAPKRQGKFCSRECHLISRELFRRMLADGRLEPLLKAELAEVLKEGSARRSGQVLDETRRAYETWQQRGFQ
jgi:hypothetical protein